MNPSSSSDKYLSLCCITRPNFCDAGCKLRERWASPIGNHNYFLSQYPLSVRSQGLIVTKIEVELNIEVDSKKDNPYIITLSPNLETEFSLSSVISSKNLNSSPSFTLGSGAIADTGITLPLAPRPEIIGLIELESNKAVWCISSGYLWRILNSSRISGLYLLKAILAIPIGTSKIVSRLHVNVCAQEWQKRQIYYFHNKFIFDNLLDNVES